MAPKTTQAIQKRALTTGTVLFDEKLTEAALRLTDPLVKDAAQVREIFHEVAKGRKAFDGLLGPAGGPIALTFDVGDWELGRRHLLRLCPKVAEYDRTSSAALRREMNKLIFADGETHVCVTAAGLTLVRYHDTAASAAVRALLPFVEPNFGWHPRRLFTCQLNTCGRWFLRPNQSGTVAMYCSTKHSNLARVRRARGQQK